MADDFPMEPAGAEEDSAPAAPSKALVRREDVALGGATIRPSELTVEGPQATSRTEPRVMQVLMAFVDAGGKVLSRDDLIRECWDGRIVGDDSIHRVIAELRKLTRETGAAFAIETIPRVGYKLTSSGATQSPSHPGESPHSEAAAATFAEPPRAAARPSRSRKWTRRAAIAGAVLTGTALGAEYFTRSPRIDIPTAPRARELLQRGQAEANRGSPASQDKAIALFRQALDEDPRYAEAWAAIAAVYRDSANPFARQPHTVREHLARWAAHRALALEPDHPEAQAVLAASYPSFGRWAEQEARLRAMVLRFPEHGRVNATMARMLFYVGRLEDALPYARRAVSRDDNSLPAWITLARIQHWAGRDAEADKTIADATTRFPQFLELSFFRFSAYIGSKRYAEAAAWIRDADRRPAGITRERAEVYAQLADALAQGREAEYLEGIRTRPPEFVAMPWDMFVQWLARLGGWDMVFASMQAAFLGGAIKSNDGSKTYHLPPPGSLSDPPTACLFHPSILEKQDDPRYLGLLQRIGMEDYWRKSGTQPDFRRG